MRYLLILVCVFCASRVASAQTPPKNTSGIVVDIDGATPPVQPYQPITVYWRFFPNVQPIVQGDLVFSLGDETTPKQVVTIPDVVLGPGEQTMKTMFPATWVQAVIPQVEVKVQLKQPNGRLLEMGTYTLRSTRTQSNQTFIIGWLESETIAKRSAMTQRLASAVQIEHLLQADDDSTRTMYRTVASLISPLTPIDAPNEPLGWCSFSRLAIQGDALEALKQDQLAALLAWLKAGGSVLMDARQIIGGRSLVVMNDWLTFAPLSEQTAYVAADGLLDLDEPLKVFHIGLGRLGIVGPKARFDQFETPAWRASLGEWWGIEPYHLKELANGKLIQLPVGAFDTPVLLPADDVEVGIPETPTLNDEPKSTNEPKPVLARAFSVLSVEPYAAGIVERLLPKAVQLPPVWLVGSILGTLVVLAGPVDYFVLGSLRVRKWTWGILPVLSVICAVVLVTTADRYIGEVGRTRPLIIHDYDHSGRLVRTNRLECLISNRSTSVTLDEVRGLLSFAQISSFDYSNMTTASFGSRKSGTESLHPVAGRYGQRYGINVSLDQWRPVLSRSLSIEDQPPPFDWSRVLEYLSEAQERANDQELRRLVSAEIQIVQPREPGIVPAFPGTPGNSLYTSAISTYEDPNRFAAIQARVLVESQPSVFSIGLQGGTSLRDLILNAMPEPVYTVIVTTSTSEGDVIHRLQYRH
jgi:hypothetical protein